MKKIMSILTVMMMALGILIASQAPQAQAEDDLLAEIKERGTLIVGTSAAYPPYQWYVKDENGDDKLAGFEMDMARDLATAMGVELEVIDMDFDAILPALASGKIDLAVAGMTPTDERKKSVDFTVPTLEVEGGNQILVHKDNADKWTSADQIPDMKVAVQKSTVQEKWLHDNYPKAKVQSIPKQTDGIMAVNSGRADGFLISGVTADIYLNHEPDLVSSEIPIEGLDDSISCIALRKGQENLLKFINQELEKMKEEGVVEKYLEDNVKLMIEGNE